MQQYLYNALIMAISKHLNNHNTFLQSKQAHASTSISLLHKTSIMPIHRNKNLKEQIALHLIIMMKLLIIIGKVVLKF
jgi:hypothetical protein